MFMNLLTTIKVCAIIAIPLMVVVIWLLPKFLNSRRSTKILISAIIVSSYAVLTVGIAGGTSLQIQNIRFVAVLTAIIWGGLGFLVGAYFDVRLRVKLGTKYYQEFPHLRMYGVEYGVICAITSLPLGIITGWLVAIFGASFWGFFLSMVTVIIFGGILGWGLDLGKK
jgi:hypothetical protein